MEILIQPTEFIVLVGAAPDVPRFVWDENVPSDNQGYHGILKAPAGKEQYVDLLKMMYQFLIVARKEGLLGLETH
ncbi:MAG: hypothetical protein R2688_04610 [Fimbriimonadaceae bacterium]